MNYISKTRYSIPQLFLLGLVGFMMSLGVAAGKVSVPSNWKEAGRSALLDQHFLQSYSASKIASNASSDNIAKKTTYREKP